MKARIKHAIRRRAAKFETAKPADMTQSLAKMVTTKMVTTKMVGTKMVRTKTVQSGWEIGPWNFLCRDSPIGSPQDKRRFKVNEK